ncbi:hypothetical protein Sango_0605600 [Sesamum angolense]|uniref:EF-hand domain-containing protein n=1 Tax=Sesamum angolense TaxID=2727404 RepID=A0AAE1X6G9_9LAMI|nr:hypothetical protein Sango_0605600 [Sesamum angolense]
MEGMREIATAYYERASEEEKEVAEAFFRKLDANGDGRVTLHELKKSVGYRLSNEKVFKQLDGNGDGTLDFYEVLAVYYMENKVQLLVCSGCWGLLVGPYFSCSLCLGKRPDTFNLCCDCYRRGNVEHEHSPKHLLDHHSLPAVLRSKEAEKSLPGKKEMEKLREIARAHYRAGSLKVQDLAYEFFKTMDTNGDGRVDLSEFLTFMRHEGYSQMHSPYFFNELDHDGNGALDFSEVMTLYYIIKSGRPFCDGCGNFIPGIFFSCVECFKNPQSPFNLCHDCYRSAICNHNHDGRVQFLDNYTLLEAKRDEALAQTAGINSNKVM